jgi:hypothetical protein
MPRYDIAHIREQGQDMIIVPLESSFGSSTSSSQQQTIAALQMHTRAAWIGWNSRSCMGRWRKDVVYSAASVASVFQRDEPKHCGRHD